MNIHQDDDDDFDSDLFLDEDDQDSDPADDDLDLEVDRLLDGVDTDFDADAEAARPDLEDIDLAEEPIPNIGKWSDPASSAEAFQEWLKNDTLRMERYLKKVGYDPERSRRIQEEVRLEAEAKRAKLKAAYKEYREAVGRGGMREGDHLDSTFIPYPAQFWTMKELKNRLAWLKKERAGLLGKPEKKQELRRNTAKIRRYTQELFRRFGKEGMEQTRAEFNRLRRSRRRIAKQRKIAGMMKEWKEKKRAERAAYKALKTQ